MQIDGSVLLFTLVTSVLTGILAGVLPGLPGRDRIAETLVAENGRSTGDRRKHRMRTGLVAWQLALSFVLLIGASLALRTFLNLRHVDTGFHGERVLSARVNLNFTTYGDAEHRIDADKVEAFNRSMEEQIRQRAGVVAMRRGLTFPSTTSSAATAPSDRGRGGTRASPRHVHRGEPVLFRGPGCPCARPRLRDRDRMGGEGVVIVNEPGPAALEGEKIPSAPHLRDGAELAHHRRRGGDVRQQALDGNTPTPCTSLPRIPDTRTVRATDDPACAAERCARPAAAPIPRPRSRACGL